MRFYSFENSTKDDTSETGELLIDIFEKTIIDNIDLKNYLYQVPIEFSGRIDLITNVLYSNIDYTEEVLVMNNIVNPFSVKTGDILYYTEIENLDLLYHTDSEINISNKQNILNINKSKGSTKRLSLLPPSVNPGIKQMDIDYGKKTITLIYKLAKNLFYQY